ncbi:hypothetical protein PROFUN_07419 [Planoprotostelium fungivorum]|uniref:Uncharacterized protein n=1 Tax=Planoprotostelium fungivorum TaxID=1890364 RepID=A0A2P6MTN1_9EUKA|nr:hypothetical protein PROFUN_07419 [Planoprotostelium fungivorum]
MSSYLFSVPNTYLMVIMFDLTVQLRHVHVVFHSSSACLSSTRLIDAPISLRVADHINQLRSSSYMKVRGGDDTRMQRRFKLKSEGNILPDDAIVLRPYPFSHTSIQHNSMPSFENKRIVFISGGGRGLALQAVKILLTEERDQVVIAGVRSVETSKRVIQELVPSIAEGNLLEVIAFDLTDKASIEKAAQHVESTYGRLDVLISSAAIATSDARTIFATNIFGTAIADEAFIPLLEKSRDAHLVEVTSGLASLCLGAVPPQTKEKFDRDDISHDEFEQLVQDYYAAADKNDYTTLYGDAHAKFYGDYGMSKMFLNVYARALAQKIKPKGYCATDLTYHQGPRSAEDGARSILTSTRVPISQTGKGWTYGHSLPFSVTTAEYDELVAKC